MPQADIIIVIKFNLNDPKKTLIKTNAKEEAVEEVLEAWMTCQMGLGKDENEHKEKDEYEIVIKLNLEDDTFYTSSDTGNKSLTAGLVVDVFNRLNELEIRELT